MPLIYGIVDDTLNVLKYVGQTRFSLQARFNGHKASSRRNGKKLPIHAWMQKHCEDRKVEIFLIEEVEEAALNETEIFWIAYFRSIGCKLLNVSAGGFGRRSKHTEEAKKRLSITLTGKKLPNRTGKLHWTAKTGKSPNKGKSFSLEHRNNIGNAKRGVRFKDRKGKPVICLNDNKTYKSQQLAADAYKLNKQQISRSCRYGHEYGGYRFAFAVT